MTGKSKRGFASMDRARQREIAAKGGRAAHEKGTAHVWSASEARIAGRKGGEAVSQDRSHMSAIGKEGGESRSAALRAARQRRAQELATPAFSNGRAASPVVGDREVAISASREGGGTLDQTMAPQRTADVSARADANGASDSVPTRTSPSMEQRSAS